MAAVSLNTLCAWFRSPATTKTMPHTCKAVRDVISNCMLAGERGCRHLLNQSLQERGFIKKCDKKLFGDIN